MTFIERIESLSSRFLTERSHELIVAPAIADLSTTPAPEPHCRSHGSRVGARGIRRRPL